MDAVCRCFVWTWNLLCGYLVRKGWTGGFSNIIVALRYLSEADVCACSTQQTKILNDMKILPQDGLFLPIENQRLR